MPARKSSTSLVARLPEARGRYRENVALAKTTWFRVGGPAEVVFRPADRDDLTYFLANRPADVAVTVIGLTSNLLVRDGGVPGVVIRLGRAFARIDVEGTDVTAGAAALDLIVARAGCQAGIAGLEFLAGVPGTIGGALRMNAGAYGVEMKDVTVAAEALDATGRVHRLTPRELGFSYRGSAVPEDWMFTAATLRGRRGERDEIARRMAEIEAAREESQPLRSRTGGSTFKNPPGASAWELIEKAGCRGLRRGGAAVSEKHCNFLVNTGTATAADLEGLGEEVRRRVFEATGVRLEWEIRRVGVPAGPAGPEQVQGGAS
ncbi:MAG: UDP-N-acetylmuramate dehydrogenase [Alphaproteobacteria bacterium]